MIKIEKTSVPKSLIEFQRTLYATFDSLPTEIKSELRASLLKEQGYICAYCMKRIEDFTKVKIEHYIPRNKDNELEYWNLLAVCTGNEGSKKDEQTCDTKKGNIPLKIDPQRELDIKTIFYSGTGKIKSSNSIFQKDLDDTLNLNCDKGYLISNRKTTLDTLKKDLHKTLKTLSPQDIQKRYNRYLDKNLSDGKYTEYVGILLWYLKRRIN